MDWIDYREKLGIGFNDENKFNMLKNRVHNFVEHMDCENYGRKSYLRYITVVCERIEDVSELNFSLDCSFEETSNISEIIYKYIVFYNTYLPDDSKFSNEFKDTIFKFLEGGLKYLRIQYELFEDDDGIFIFPKGAQEFDDALVSQPLEWLTKYPQAHKTFCIALRQYSDGIYIRDVADNLRKALEEFLREFLGNNCDFNKNKKEVEAYLKSQNADPQLINIFGSLINHYYLMNNNIAKHTDKVDAKYLEFLMYQTGIFIRMLIVVKQAEQEVPSDAD